MTRLLHPVTSNDIPFFMRVVGRGDRYGINMAFTHEADQLAAENPPPADPLIEFYDRRSAMVHDLQTGMVLGQFVSRYHLSTLMTPFNGGTSVFERGLDLDACIDSWKIDPAGMRSCRHALMAAKIIDAPEGKSAAWMMVMADAPIVGLDPHPSYAPQEDLRGTEPDRSPPLWVHLYNTHSSLMQIEAEIAEDHQARQQAVEAEDMSDEGSEDVPLPVFVTEDGAVEFLDFTTGDIMARHEAREIYERGFGMEFPYAEEMTSAFP